IVVFRIACVSPALDSAAARQPDISPAKAVRPVDLGDRAVSQPARCGKITPERRHPEHPPAIRQQPVAVAFGSGMENLYLSPARLLETADLGAAQRLVGIAP